MISNDINLASMKNNPQQIKSNLELLSEETKPNSIISSDSTNDSNLNVHQNTKKYIFKSHDISYSLYMSLNEDKILISVNSMKDKKEESYYERDFTQEELKTSNKVFKLCSDIKESYDYLNDLFSSEEKLFNVYEGNNGGCEVFTIEKKMQLSQQIKIEIPKKIKNIIAQNNIIIEEYIENNNKNNNNNYIEEKNNMNKKDEIKKNVSERNDIESKLNALEHDGEELKELIKNKFVLNEVMFGKLTEHVCKIDEILNNSKKIEEESKKMHNLLNKKRGSLSDISEISFNSNNSEGNNTNNNKKSKNNLEKENFLKIFSDNNSINSDNSNGKFFMKILKQKQLEKENNIKNNVINNNKNNIISIKEEMEYEKDKENESLLYGDKDEDDIKDDIDFFSNNSLSIGKRTPSPSSNNVNNHKMNNNIDNNINNNNIIIINGGYNKNNSHNKSQNSLISKDILFDSNHNNIFQQNNINNNQNMEINYFHNPKNRNFERKISSEWTVNNSYNMIGGLLEKGKESKRSNNYLKKLSYRVVNQDKKEMRYLDFERGFQDKNNYLNMFSVDSKIISNYGDLDFILNYIKYTFNKQINSSIRIYRATEDGDRAEDFHKNCDGNTDILVLIKTKNGKKFGGYTSIGFNNLNQSKEDDAAFIFSIDKREIYPKIKGKKAVDSFYNLGPSFSGDSIKIFDNFLKKGGITSKAGTNFGTNEDFQINDGSKFFGVEEIEVFEFLDS